MLIPPLASCWSEAGSESRLLTCAQAELVVYSKEEKTDATILICTRTKISSVVHSQAELSPHKKTRSKNKKKTLINK